MSITVADVLKLPSMRGAKVLGGSAGLGRIVSSISVLEYAQANDIQAELFDHIEFLGNELAITGFMNNPDDVNLQCTNLRRGSLPVFRAFWPARDPLLCTRRGAGSSA